MEIEQPKTFRLITTDQNCIRRLPLSEKARDSLKKELESAVWVPAEPLPPLEYFVKRLAEEASKDEIDDLLGNKNEPSSCPLCLADPCCCRAWAQSW